MPRSGRSAPPASCAPSCATVCPPVAFTWGCAPTRPWPPIRSVSTSADDDHQRLSGSRAQGIALVLFTACTWGLTWPQSKYLLTMLPPFSMRGACGVAGFSFAFLVALIRRERIWPPRDQWPRLILFAMLNYGVFIVLTTESLVWLKASEAVL